ncbi:MAG: outer membrane lipoprotein carrier protein LolA [Pseudomonadota bacterium]
MFKTIRIFTLLMLMILFAASVLAEQTNTMADNKTDLDEVLQRLETKMAKIKTLKTAFIQEKELAVFNSKVVLKGMIYIEKPYRLAWRVNEPLQYIMIMSENTISQWDEDTKKVQKISLSKNPAFEAVIGQMRGWFSGAYTQLVKDYDVILVCDKPVSLKFVPKTETFAGNVIKSVTVDFRKDEQYIQKIFIEEKSGDTTSLMFVDTNVNIEIEPAAWRLIPIAG